MVCFAEGCVSSMENSEASRSVSPPALQGSGFLGTCPCASLQAEGKKALYTGEESLSMRTW